MDSPKYEIFHGDGGHGGPYKSSNEAIIAAMRFARLEAAKSIHAVEVVKEYTLEGFKARFVVKAHRCLDCGDVHVCVSGA